MAINPILKQPKTQDEVDDAFETWFECAHELGILDLFQVVSYNCAKDNETVAAISFATDYQSLINHFNNILEEDKLKWSTLVKI